jgi:hypothetical protein
MTKLKKHPGAFISQMLFGNFTTCIQVSVMIVISSLDVKIVSRSDKFHNDERDGNANRKFSYTANKKRRV